MKTRTGRDILALNRLSERSGEFVLIEFPFTNLKGSKMRPGLILGQGDRTDDYILAFVSCEVDAYLDAEFAIEVSASELSSGTIHQKSVIRVDKTACVHSRRFARERVAQLNDEKLREILHAWTRLSVRNFSQSFHGANRPGTDPMRPTFKPGVDVVPYAGRVFTEDEVEAAVSSTLDFWLTLGTEGEAFEKELAAYLGVRHSIVVNSGSSANLLAFSALTSHMIPAEKRIMPGDEVITVAAGFPTTVAPIIQCGAIPVFIDNDPITGNARVEMLEEAYIEGKTKAVMMAHTLGNPFDLDTLLEFCRKYDLWLIEDNCDSLGSTYSIPIERAKSLGLQHLLRQAESNARLPTIRNGLLEAYTGSFGDISTQSFYPPHHITMGEGGAVNVIRDSKLAAIVESYRDWGRDCWCASGKDNTCGKRFEWKLGELPEGYDHKYIYTHLGYNLKPLDLQAAIGRCQLRKLPEFVDARRKNWDYLRAGLTDLEEYFEFSLPTHSVAWTMDGFEWNRDAPDIQPGAKSTTSGQSRPSTLDPRQTSLSCSPSWFGFMLQVRSSSPFRHFELTRHLDEKKIGNRMIFGGNLLRQPFLLELTQNRPEALRVVGDLNGADQIMNQALFLGAFPGLTKSMLDYEISIIRDFVSSRL